jgi:GNAT superfamily N-acetyltransferase
MPDAVEVRPARVEDLAALLPLYEQLSAENAGLSTEAARPAFEAMLANASLNVLVAEVDGRVAATATLVVVPNLTHGAQPWAQLENMVVDAAARGTGVGRTLLGRCVAMAWEAGCYKVQLQSANAREGAHRFYEAAGFAAASKGYRLYR